ncbi:hypothetical protein [Chitiniphilus shinanonensis]|uniref:hypothetical protein n=1 Tax=Chitiniphilus shinanonensis TaxID=553088 RepID=UPI0012FC7154|nr:hypothetical protein [Chitiniphilus shinanonensis]
MSACLRMWRRGSAWWWRRGDATRWAWLAAGSVSPGAWRRGMALAWLGEPADRGAMR